MKKFLAKLDVKNVGKSAVSRKSAMVFAVLIFGSALFPGAVFAGNPLIDSVVGQGAMSLIEDATTAMIWVSAPLGGAAFTYCAVRKGNCDETETKKWTDRMKTTAVCTGLALGGSALVNVLLSYFSASP